jgi:thioredoxin reductase (NADPH)
MTMLDAAVAFPVLNDADLALLEGLGTRQTVGVGEYLFRQGDEIYNFYVVLSAVVEIVVPVDGSDHVIVRHGAGRFVGELGHLTGQRVLVSARVVEPGDVLALSREALRHVIATNPRLSDTFLAAFLERRTALLTHAAEAIRLVGSRFSSDTRRIREYLTRSRIPHAWLDPDSDASVDGLLREFSVVPSDLPVVFAGSYVLRRATAGALAECLGLTVASLPDRSFDLVVVGAGPAGLAAGVYGASEGLRTLMVDMDAVGGQAATSSRIENYLGFPTGISGGDLTARALVQAEKFGAFLSSPCAVTSMREVGGHLVLHLSDGTDVVARAVIAATGARYRRLEVDRLEDFEGNGVYYAATELEARLCAGSPVAVVGGGNSAGQAAVFLADSGSAVHVVIRGADLGKSMSRYLVDRIEAHPGIQAYTNSQVTRLDGDKTLTAVRIARTDGDVQMPCSGLFSLIGADPCSDWLSGCAVLDQQGFVVTDLSLHDGDLDETWRALARQPLPFETSRPGLFAVGDVRSGSTKRVAAAVGEGSAAVRSVHQYLAFGH